MSSDKVSLRLLIFALGAGASLYQGVDRILHPHAMVDPLVNIVVLGCSNVRGLLMVGGAQQVCRRKGRTAPSRGGGPPRARVPPFKGMRQSGIFLIVFDEVSKIVRGGGASLRPSSRQAALPL